jgi:putative spermidine/putrescine transport system ATP-binding protein
MKDFKTISVRHITKSFKDKTAVHDFSLEFGKGEFVTFLGPSGCGKSTALNCITGLIPLTSGEIWIDDECIDNSKTQVAPEKREFGMVFQNYALFPHLTVYENIAFGLKLRRMSKVETDRRVEDAIKLVHLEGYEKKFPSQMSGGEQQRVAIARCVVLEPRLLLLDEPLSNLDAKLRIELRYELKALHERLKITTIYVTHDQTEALALSDRIVVLRSGEIQQVGTPSQIFSDPANLFVADFMGFKNFWDVRIESLDEEGESLKAKFSVGGVVLNARLPYRKGDPRREGIARAFGDGVLVRTAIRPEDICVGGGTGMNNLKAIADLVEYQGQSSQVSAALLGAVGAKTEGPRVDLKSICQVLDGETMEIGIPEDKILIFPIPKTVENAGGGKP